MSINYAGGKKTASATVRLVVAGVSGLIAGFLAAAMLKSYLAPLVAWDTAAIVYLGWMWLTIRGLKDSETRDFALREDPARGVTDFLLIFTSIASLGAVAIVLLSGSTSGATAQVAVGAALGVFSVVLSWTLTHTIFMLRYAELYYSGNKRGIEFDGTTQPSFRDFAYLSFTIGMTFQVSDTGFKSTAFRSLALKHAVLSYLFGTVIVATTINLVAGLSK